MSDFSISDEYMSELREQFEKWADFLNTAIGLLSFSFALACLGTKTPALNAWLALLVVGFVRYKGSHIFPGEILRLRKAAKTDQKARVVLVGLSKEFLGFKALVTGYPIFLIGALLLMLIAASSWLITPLPFLKAYIGT